MAEKIIYSLIVFGLLVLFHELGHFAFAKWVGVQIYEFSIGFGPRLFGFKLGETTYNIRGVPLGGFVRMAGMDPEEDKREAGGEILKDGEDEAVVDPKRSFNHQSVLKRMAIIVAGPVMNLLLAIVLFASSFLIFGMPENKNIIGGILQDKPAAEAGLRPGDVINKINDVTVKTWEDVVTNIHKHPDKQISLEIQRGQEKREVTIIPQKDPDSQWGMIGITYPTRQPGVFEASKLGVLKTYDMIRLTGYFIGKMVSKEMPVELSGPVRITYELGKAAEMGMLTLMNFAGLLSIQIGLFNLFPIPALDGSRLVFLIVEGLRGTPVDPSKENFVHLVGLALLLLLMVVVTYKDIVQMFS